MLFHHYLNVIVVPILHIECFLNKDINNHKQNFLNYFVGFFPVKLPIVLVVVMLDHRIYN